MKKVFAVVRYLSLAPVLTLLVTFALALWVGVLKSVSLWSSVITGQNRNGSAMLELIQIVDVFLIATVVYLLATSIYNLFIGDPGTSPKLVAHDLTELKTKLSSILVLVLAVHFVEVLFENHASPLDTLWLALASTAVAGVLIAFSWFSHSEGKGSA
jgi:uncharacterized membrane protein YqhA